MITKTIAGLVESMRPHQWSKNLLLFAGVVFSGSLRNPSLLAASVAGFCCFCLASGGVYVLNDLVDVERDQHHPQKRTRPIASGAINRAAAVSLMAALLAAAFAVAALQGPPLFVLLVGVYVALNVGYSFALKNVVVVDVVVVAAGFVVRAVAGAVVVGVAPSQWLIVCTLCLALMAAFGKRRHELGVLVDADADADAARAHRPTLNKYSIAVLNKLVGILGATVITAYTLYTLSDHAQALFGSRRLLVTVPIVLAGVLRYLHLVLAKGEGGDPARLLLRDKPLLVTALLWGVAVAALIYG